MITDPISDMLTRMRNALGAKHEQVKVPHSKVKAELARIFKESGYITKFSVEGEGITKHLLITLPDQSVITSLIRVSKPGRRIYAAADEIPTILSGRGMVIVSTSSGIMTGRDARRAGLGGELICKVW
jgi:small subunit ribosomal protein S8